MVLMPTLFLPYSSSETRKVGERASARGTGRKREKNGGRDTGKIKAREWARVDVV